MDYYQILAFTFIALLLVVSPGPNGLLIMKTVSISGKNAGFANVLGFVTSFYLHGALSIFGISILLTKSAEAFFIVKLLGAIYLIWIGIKSLISAVGHKKIKVESPSKNTKKTLVKAYIEGLLTNALNPKVSMFYLAAFPQFISVDGNVISYAFLLVSIHALMNMLWFGAMIMLVSRLTFMGKKYVVQKLLKTITGVVFIGFGVKLATLQHSS